MRPRLINTGYYLSVLRRCKGRLNFVAVMIRVFHTDYPFNLAESAEQFLDTPLLPFKLLAIAHILELTPAAFFIKLTSFFALLNHFLIRHLMLPLLFLFVLYHSYSSSCGKQQNGRKDIPLQDL